MKMPSKEQILEASKDCPDAKEVLKKLFPEAFKEEKEDKWEDITDEVEVRVEHLGNLTYYLVFEHEGEQIGFSHFDMQFIELDSLETHKIDWYEGDFRIFKRRGK